MKDPTNPVCRTISTLLSRIGDKWTVLVVQTLGEGPKRFNQLRREIPSVSQRMKHLDSELDHRQTVHAAAIVAAFEAKPNAGVLSVGGRMVDRPHLVQAQRVLERAKR